MRPADARADTPLRRQLLGADATRSSALDAFRHARREFLGGERIDMRQLAKALEVDRATLYRWVGSRDLLLTEILWSLIERTFADDEIRARRLDPAVPTDDLSFVLVRIMESYIYIGHITGEPPRPNEQTRPT